MAHADPRPFRRALLTATALVPLQCIVPARAAAPLLPTGGSFAAGSGTIAQSGASLTVRHAEEWIAHVLRPLVQEAPERARYLAEGALMRLTCGARCFEAYRSHLWGQPAYAGAE